MAIYDMHKDDSSEAFQRIEEYLSDFSTGIENCRNAEAFLAADLQDAYARFGRLRARYLKEKPNLGKSQREALSKVFENDIFTKGMMNIRHVGEHVKKRSDFRIFTTSNTPITLDPDSSAAAVFSAPTVFLYDTNGNGHHLDHLEMLQELEKRIISAIDRAR